MQRVQRLERVEIRGLRIESRDIAVGVIVLDFLPVSDTASWALTPIVTACYITLDAEFCFFTLYPKVAWTSLYPDATPEAIDLLERMLTFNPDRRITAENALAHPYFAEYHDPADEVRTLGDWREMES